MRRVENFILAKGLKIEVLDNIQVEEQSFCKSLVYTLSLPI